MSLTPPPPLNSGSFAANVAGFPSQLSPYPNVQPFSYPDGLTFQKLFESYRNWLLTSLVPHINDQADSIIAEYNTASAALSLAMGTYTAEVEADRASYEALVKADRDTFIASVTAQTNLINSTKDITVAAKTAAEAARDKAEQWASNTQVLQDTAVSTLLADPASLTKGSLIGAVNPRLTKRRSNTFTFIGDSITAAGNTTLSGSTVGGRTRNSASYMNWLQVFLGHRLHIISSQGVSGETIGQIALRINDAIATGSSNIFLLGGINSIKGGVDYATIVNDFKNIIVACQKAGVTLFIGTVLPARVPDVNNHLDIWDQVNSWLMSYAGACDGVVVIPWHTVLIDPTTGNPVPATVSDGLHPNIVGSRLIAEYAANIMRPMFPEGAGNFQTRAGDVTNALPNGFMTGTGGLLNTTANAGIATGWTIKTNGDQAVTPSKIARSDGFGEWQQLRITGGTPTTSRDSGIQLLYKFTGLPETPNPALAINRTDWVYAQCEFETDADFINASMLQLMLKDDSFTLLSRFAGIDSSWLTVGGVMKGTLRTTPVPASVLPFVSGTTPNKVSSPLTASVSVAGLTGGTSATIRIGRFTVSALKSPDNIG